MKKYKSYNKREVERAMDNTAIGFDILKPFQWWESGAKELEKTSLGKVLTAPVRLPEAVLTSTKKTVEQVPETVKSITKAIPILAVSAALIGVAVLLYKLEKGKGSANTSAERMVL